MNDFLFPFFSYSWRKDILVPFRSKPLILILIFLKAGCFMNHKVTLVLIQMNLEIHFKK